MQNIPNCFMRFVRHFVVVLATSGQQQRRRRLLRAPALAVHMYACLYICGRPLSHFLALAHTPTAAVGLELVCRDVIAYTFMRVYCVSFVFVFNNFWGRVSGWNLNCA